MFPLIYSGLTARFSVKNSYNFFEQIEPLLTGGVLLKEIIYHSPPSPLEKNLAAEPGNAKPSGFLLYEIPSCLCEKLFCRTFQFKIVPMIAVI